jgi:hypothetical protein
MDVQTRQIREQVRIGLTNHAAQSLFEMLNRLGRVLASLRGGGGPVRLVVRLRQGGVDGSQHPVCFGVARRELECLFGGGHRLGDLVLAHVKASELGRDFGSRRVEGHGALVRRDRPVDVIVALQSQAQHVLVIRLGDAGRR